MSVQNQSDLKNPPLTDNENRVIEEAENARSSFQQILLLDGIVLQDKVEVFPGIHLVPLPRSLGKKGEKIPRYVSERAPAVEGIEYFFHKTQLIIDPSEAHSEGNRERFCQALSLACNSAVQIATYLSVRKDEEPFSLVPYGGPTVTHMPRDPVKSSDIQEAKRLYQLLDGLAPDVQQKLHIPINRWIKSHAEQNGMFNQKIDPEILPEDIPCSPTTRMVDKMIDLGIAFESLYLSGSGNLSLDLRNRAARYLSESEDCQKRLKAILKEIYSWRSKAVHKGTLPAKDVKIAQESFTPSEFIKEAQLLCRRSILKILEDPCPRVILNLDKEYLKPLLENGRKFRKCKVYLKCRLRLTDSNDYQLHAMIPPDGISKKGYVGEVWVEYVTKSIEINNQDYELMIPEAHHSGRWIQELRLDSDGSKLLPNPDKIVVKYCRGLKESKFDKESS